MFELAEHLPEEPEGKKGNIGRTISGVLDTQAKLLTGPIGRSQHVHGLMVLLLVLLMLCVCICARKERIRI